MDIYLAISTQSTHDIRYYLMKYDLYGHFMPFFLDAVHHGSEVHPKLTKKMWPGAALHGLARALLEHRHAIRLLQLDRLR